MAATSTYRYGRYEIPNTAGELERSVERGFVPLPGRATPAGVLRQRVRAAWDQEPSLEMTRQALKSEAVRSGIAGTTGSYGDAARRTGFSQALSQIAGPREIGPLAQLYKRAWGTQGPIPAPEREVNRSLPWW